MKDKKIAIVGFGYVGQAVAKFFGTKFSLELVDSKFENETLAGQFFGPHKVQEEKANECQLAVLSVPTPMSEDGSVDLSAVRSVFSWLKVPLILIKSTIPPGTCEALKAEFPDKRIVFSPEYIGEGKYPVPFWKDIPHPTDMRLHSFTILGGDKADTSEVLQYFKEVAGAEMKYHQVDHKTAELCKYMENAFLATKVIFVNEFFEIAKTHGVDFDTLREIWLLDGRIGRSHSTVYPLNRGFSGKCLPKDVNGIVKATQAKGYEPELLKTVLAVNKTIRNE